MLKIKPKITRIWHVFQCPKCEDLTDSYNQIECLRGSFRAFCHNCHHSFSVDVSEFSKINPNNNKEKLKKILLGMGYKAEEKIITLVFEQCKVGETIEIGKLIKKYVELNGR